MRLITFDAGSGERAGAWFDGDRKVLDIGIAARLHGEQEQPFSDLLSIIEAGSAAWDKVRRWVASPIDAAVLPSSGCRLAAPLRRPPAMRDFLTFEQHLLNAFAAAKTIRASLAADPESELRRIEANGMFSIPQIWYEKPIFYNASVTAIGDPGQDVVWPSYSRIMDYELELAVVIGKRGRDIRVTDAIDHVFGFTIFNDFSARDEQTLVMEGKLGPGKGKDFDGANVLGPCIVTLDEIGDFSNLGMVARINGEEWSRGSSASMHHSFADMIAYASQSQTLHPGEILCSGTVGTGCGAELGRFLRGDDIVELEIERIGVLQNRVLAAQGA